jgi:hypothetical protein
LLLLLSFLQAAVRPGCCALSFSVVVVVVVVVVFVVVLVVVVAVVAVFFVGCCAAGLLCALLGWTVARGQRAAGLLSGSGRCHCMSCTIFFFTWAGAAQG